MDPENLNVKAGDGPRMLVGEKTPSLNKVGGKSFR